MERGRRRGESERRDREHDLARRPKGLPARGHDRQSRACANHANDELGNRPDDVLAVVEKQQQRLGAHEIEQAVGDGHPGFTVNPQGARDLAVDLLRIRDGGKLDEPGTIRVTIAASRGRLEHQSRLAGATGSDQRD